MPLLQEWQWLTGVHIEMYLIHGLLGFHGCVCTSCLESAFLALSGKGKGAKNSTAMCGTALIKREQEHPHVAAIVGLPFCSAS